MSDKNRRGDLVKRVPLVDLTVMHDEILAEIEEAFSDVIREARFVGGTEVGQFEREFAEFCGRSHCVGVANGTDALELSLRACGIRPRDEVIVPANSFIASAGAVWRAGATPVFVDVDPETLLIDVDETAERIGRRTKAIVPVHLYGQMAPVEGISAAAAAANVVIVEDAAQAQGATRYGKGMGGYGRIAATSFYPGKNLGAFGDGGAVVTDEERLAQRVRELANHGSTERYHHVRFGCNSRLDTLQAVVLKTKLSRLNQWNEQRRIAAARYHELLAPHADVRTPETLAGNDHVWHLYVVRVPRRDDVVRHLQREGIDVGLHYPVPLHLQPACTGLGYRSGDFPVAEKAADEILSLPMFPGITPEQQDRVVDTLAGALETL